MNKLLLFPIAVMFILTIFSSIFSDEYYSGSTPDHSSTGEIVVDNSTTEITVPEGGSHSFNIWGISGAMVILTIAVTVGILLGIHVVGSGISDTSQKMVFSSILFLGLWTYLSIVSAEFFFALAITTIAWVGLTMIFILGVGFHMTQGDTA